LGRLEVFADAQRLAVALASLFSDTALAAITQRGAFYVALAGGSTPRAAYQLLATPRPRDRISWSDVFVYFGDERCVAPTDPLSNYLMAQETLLRNVPIPPHNVHRMHGEDPPAQAAAAYAQVLRADCGTVPRLDLIMLGLGKDAHTASLFPGGDPLTDDDLLVRPTYSQETQTDRLTITPQVINNARAVVIAAEGSEKASAVAAVRDGNYDPARFPAQIVSPRDGDFVWLLDKLSAGGLHGPV
jgi:6-phosphogluconolactonase